MVNINCLKSFQSYYKIDITYQKKDPKPNNMWTVQKFNADGKRCLLFLHHTTAVYFTIFGFERKDLVNIELLFVDSLISEMETHIKISKTEKAQIRNYFKDFSFYEASNNKDVNSLVNTVISTIKGLNILNYNQPKPLTIEEYYNQIERFFNKNNCEKLKDILLK